MNLYYAIGARCGHADAKQHISGQGYNYTNNSNISHNLAPAFGDSDKWLDGYERGYALGLAGDPLPPEIANAPLP